MNEENRTRGYMFDTVIFNRIVDNEIDIEPLKTLPLCVTHIQNDELSNTKSDVERRDRLLQMFKVIGASEIPTESAIWSISRWGKCKWSDGKLLDNIKADLDQLEKKKNNVQDSLIAETSIKNGFVLVTEDTNLLEIVNRRSGKAIRLAQFLNILGKGVKP